jgi:SAM-dependent methyltransferase
LDAATFDFACLDVENHSFSVPRAHHAATNHMNSEDAGFSYDSIAAQYAAKVDSAPYNAFYERPAMLGMLPPVDGLRILDAGCGPGWYTGQLLERGARVDGIDASAEMVAHATRRLSHYPAAVASRATLRVASLGETLPFADSAFDGAISPLVLHYLPDWRPALREIRRVLAPGGWLLLSTHHPAADAALFETSHYFDIEHVTDVWDWVGTVEFYRRSLTEIFASLKDANLAIESVVEPVPTQQFFQSKPDAYARLMRQPEFLILKVVRHE